MNNSAQENNTKDGEEKHDDEVIQKFFEEIRVNKKKLETELNATESTKAKKKRVHKSNKK